MDVRAHVPHVLLSRNPSSMAHCESASTLSLSSGGVGEDVGAIGLKAPEVAVSAASHQHFARWQPAAWATGVQTPRPCGCARPVSRGQATPSRTAVVPIGGLGQIEHFGFSLMISLYKTNGSDFFWECRSDLPLGSSGIAPGAAVQPLRSCALPTPRWCSERRGPAWPASSAPPPAWADRPDSCPQEPPWQQGSHRTSSPAWCGCAYAHRWSCCLSSWGMVDTNQAQMFLQGTASLSFT